MLSQAEIGSLHEMQWDPGKIIDSFFGSRCMHTFTKLPSIKPRNRIAVICNEKGVLIKKFIPGQCWF
jgi:hypothetical protein